MKTKRCEHFRGGATTTKFGAPLKITEYASDIYIHTLAFIQWKINQIKTTFLGLRLSVISVLFIHLILWPQ